MTAYCFSHPCWKRPAGLGPLAFQKAGAIAFIAYSSRGAKIRSGAPVSRRILAKAIAKTVRICSNSRATRRPSFALPFVRTRKLGLRTSIQGFSPAWLDNGMTLSRSSVEILRERGMVDPLNSESATRRRLISWRSKNQWYIQPDNSRSIGNPEEILGLRAGELTQPGQQTVYFFRGVVMHEADA